MLFLIYLQAMQLSFLFQDYYFCFFSFSIFEFVSRNICTLKDSLKLNVLVPLKITLFFHKRLGVADSFFFIPISHILEDRPRKIGLLQCKSLSIAIHEFGYNNLFIIFGIRNCQSLLANIRNISSIFVQYKIQKGFTNYRSIYLIDRSF